jgi:hypothetical protein
MDKANYGMLLDTISITLDCLNATTTDYLPELGTVQQSLWTEKEVDQFRKQLKGLMALIPNPSYFQNPE